MASPILRVSRSLLLLAAVAGCEPVPPEDSAAEVGTSAADIRIANSLTTQELVANAIAANHDANEALAQNALSFLFDPDVVSSAPERALMANQLHDPYAQRFMEYVVGCALKAGDKVVWTDPFAPVGNQRRQWEGSAGLCPQWGTSTPSDSCLRRVTACLLARNNALGKRVDLSMRGELDEPTQSLLEPFALDAWTVPLDYSPVTSGTLASASACSGATQGVGRDCGWQMHSVRWCPAGQTVSVGAGGASTCPAAAPLGSTTGARMMLRVCQGIHGCDTTDGRLLAQSQGCTPGSTSTVASGFTNPFVTVTCPSQGGYLTVMTAPWDSTTVGTANVAVSNGPSSPLGERAVYRIREGAFYGNMFGPDMLRDDIDVQVRPSSKAPGRWEVLRPLGRQKEPLFKHLYSCYDPGWSNGLAYATYRVCALPNTLENCAATVTGPCWAPDSKPRQCQSQDGALLTGDGDFEVCDDPDSNTWLEPVTVFLNGPCDLVDDQHRELCKRVDEPPVPTNRQGTEKR